MNTMKKFFALILSLCMILSMVPVSAFAAECDDAGDAMVTGTDSTTDTITLSGKPETPDGLTNQTEPFPLALFTTYNSSSNGHYRIPGIVTLDDGTLVASADARWKGHNNGYDDSGNIDSVVSYSSDNGKTWNVTFANYYGDDNNENKYVQDFCSATYIDPGLITDGKTLYMIADLYPGQASNANANCTGTSQYAVGYDSDGHLLLRENGTSNDTNAKYYLKSFTSDGHTYYEIYTIDGNTKQENQLVDAWFNLYTKGENDTWNYYRNLFAYSENSYMPIMTSHLYLTTSTDGGKTWSEPTMLNPAVRNSSEKYYLVSPGRGLTTSDGTVVIGAYGNQSGAEKASIIFYDGQSWHRSSQEAPTSSSESEIVELSDGTLRMFVRHAGYGDTVVQYFDWTPVKDANGKVTDYTPSAAVSTSVPSDKNVNISAISYSRDADGKQVILVAVAAATSGNNGYPRMNGKIYTFVVNDDKTMTLKNGFQITGESEAYSYSCLTELADGTIGLLYEKGDSGNITWAIYDAEDVTGLDLSKDVVNEEAKVTVTVPNSSNVTHLVATRKTDLEGLTSDSYAAYDLTLCTCTDGTCDGTNATPYTGSATVTIPISDELAAEDLKAFVLNSNGTPDYFYGVTISGAADSYTATFRAPHFSVVGVTPKTEEESKVTIVKDLTLYVNQQHTETIDGINATGTYTDDSLNVTWTGTSEEVTYPTATVVSDDSTIDLNDCLYTFNKNADGTWVISADADGTTVYVRPHGTAQFPNVTTAGTYTDVTIGTGSVTGTFKLINSSSTAANGTGYLHWHNSGEKYWNQCGSDECGTAHDIMIYQVSDEQNATNIMGGYYTQITDASQLVSGKQYLIVATRSEDSATVYYAMHPTTSTTDAKMHVAKITGSTATRTDSTTTVVFDPIAVTESAIPVIVGNVQYNVTVDLVQEEQSVVVGKGGTVTITLPAASYLTQTPAIADGAKASVTLTPVQGTAITSKDNVTDGAYMIYCIHDYYTVTPKPYVTNINKTSALLYRKSATELNTEGWDHALWNVTRSGDGLTITDVDGKYMTINTDGTTLSESEQILNWHDHNGGILIGQNSTYMNPQSTDEVNDWTSSTDDGSRMNLIPVTGTTVTITGLSAGTTDITLGNVTIHVTVTGEQDVNLHVGETIHLTQSGSNVTGSVTDNATVSVDYTGYEGNYWQIEKVTDTNTLTDGEYLIFYRNSNYALTSDQGASSWSTVTRKLQASGIAPNDVNTWTITAVDGGYTIKHGTQYLSLGSGDNIAELVSDTSVLTITWNSNNSAYRIADTERALTWLGGSGDDNYSAGGYPGTNGEFDLYRVVRSENANAHTIISVTGNAVGDTELSIGNMTYNFHVTESVKNITAYAGQTLTITDETGNYTQNFAKGDGWNDSIATLDTVAGTTSINRTGFAPVNAIESGKQYLIVYAGNNKILTSNKNSNGNRLQLDGNWNSTASYWTITRSGNGYTVMNSDGYYLNIPGDGQATLGAAAQLAIACGNDGTWTINQNDYYLNNYASEGYAAGWKHSTAATNSNSQWGLYEVTGTATSSTTATVNCLSGGDVSLRIGYTTYNIHILDETVDIELNVGEDYTDTIYGYKYDSVTTQPNTDVANVTVSGENAAGATEVVSSITSGKRYVIANVRHNAPYLTSTATGTHLLMQGAYSDEDAATWTIVQQSDGTYTIQDTATGKYLYFADGVASVRDNATRIKLTYVVAEDNDPAHWLIECGAQFLNDFNNKGTDAAGYKNGEGDEGSHWYLYEATPERTEVKFTGVAEGETIVRVGHINYKITVVEPHVDVSLFVGETKIITLDDTVESGSNEGDSDSTNIASVAWSTKDGGTNTTITVTGKNVGTTTVEIGGVKYNITVVPFEKQFSLAIGDTASYQADSTVTQEQITAFNDANSSIVTVALSDGTLTFTGVREGSVTAQLGNTVYKVKVTPVVATADDTKYIGGQSDTQGYQQKVTGLIISNNTTYDLNLDDSVTGTITWESSDDTLFTVDENGTVRSGDKAGEGYITVKVDGTAYQTIPVTVLETNKSGTTRTVDIYNTEVTNCTAYYSYCSGELVEFPEGTQFYVVHSVSETDFISFWAVPDEGYALTYINGTGGTYYHVITNEEGTEYGSEFESAATIPTTSTGGYDWAYDQLISRVVKNADAASVDQIEDLIRRAIILEADGMFFYSRAVTQAFIKDSTTFVAERLPGVEKEVAGVLDSEKVWTEYFDGMFAQVNDLVYFKVTVAIDKPLYWEGNSGVVTSPDDVNAKRDSYGPLAALEYSTHSAGETVDLEDLLNGAMFYVKADDENMDGLIDSGESKIDIKADMNRGWTAEEIAAGERVLTYYVVYKVQTEDYNNDMIENTVNLSYTYTSTYSAGYQASAAEASAALRILGDGLKDAVVDFGLPVVVTLTHDNLPKGVDINNTNNAINGCMFGSVSIEQTEGALTENPSDDVWELTYTPNKVMTSYDVVYLMDADNNLINYIRIRPASTVYYEESFADYGSVSSETSGWTNKQEVTGAQKYQDAGCENPEHGHNNFGFDGKYQMEWGMSNCTEAVSNLSGDTATFTFAGTGFDLYANTDPYTSTMAVLVYKVDKSTDTKTLVKFYQVVTANKSGGSVVVPTIAYSLPVVSITDLDHGTYEVVVRHTKKADDTTSQIRLDGFRIYNTVANSDGYYPSEEKNVTFTELRDHVLSALEVNKDSTCDQVYSKIEGANAEVVYASENAVDANDLLKYGPKNEIWMKAGDTLSFTLDKSVKYAQIGLKSPYDLDSSNATVTITVKSTNDPDGAAIYTNEELRIYTATDMFYRLNNANTAYTGSVTVTIQVTEGFLSVTKLKTSTYVKDSTSDTPATTQALAPVSRQQIAVALNVMYGTKTESPAQSVVRYSGSDRYATAISVANEMLALRGLEKFDTVIVASGSNFADALAGSYLASKTCAPILLSGTKDSQNARVIDYIKTHLAENGTVYILGGDAAVPESYDQELASFTVKRLAGATRYETNLEILKETGIPAASEILVCTGVDYADSLSAAATGRPILLVSSKNGVSYGIHDEYLRSIEGLSFTIIGGDGAVSLELEEQLSAYGTTHRLSGKTRYETSVLVAQTYFPDAEGAALAYAWEFPDGLCGGPLACALNVPILLLSDTNYAAAQDYVQQQGISDGIVLGGDSRIADTTIRQVFALAEDATITVK